MYLLFQVPYAASEVEDTLVQALQPEQNFRILTPIIQTMEYHIACGAIQMMTKVVEKMPQDILESSLPNLIPGLFKVSLTTLWWTCWKWLTRMEIWV